MVLMDDDEVDSDLEDLETLIDLSVDSAVSRVSNSRYLFRGNYRSSVPVSFTRDLSTGGEFETPWLTDEFLEKYRMRRDSFQQLVGLIKDHPVF